MLLDVDPVQPENSLPFCSNAQGIRDQCGALFEVEWSEICRATPVKRLVQQYQNARQAYLPSVLQNEGKCWTEFYKYVKRRKGNRENISAIKDCNGRPITDSTEKSNCLNSYYVSVFDCERNIPKIQATHSIEPFTINIKMVRKRLVAIGGKISAGLGGVPGEII